MKRYDKHIFVCQNVRPDDHPRGCCMGRGGAEVRDALKDQLKQRGLLSTMRVNGAGCLDACEYGPVVVVYPEQIWYGNVKPEDAAEIVESHFMNGKPVERLMIQDKKFHRDAENDVVKAQA